MLSAKRAVWALDSPGVVASRKNASCAIAASLVLALFLTFALTIPVFAAEHPQLGAPKCCILFKPLDKQPEETRALLVEKWNAGLGRETSAEPDALVNALIDYELNPNVTTALAALDQQFKVLAGNDGLRAKAFGTDLKLFLTLDVLKFELPLQATLRLNKGRNPKERAVFSYRVGSSGQRFQKILRWRKNGGDLSQIVAELGDQQYVLNKLGKSDDDVTNTARRAAIVDNPVLNEALNGKRATDELTTVSGQWGHAIDFKTVKTEFLSPTKAYSILRLRPPGAKTGFARFQAAYIAADQEKYRGLSAEEQLHDWGKSLGIAIDLRNLGPDSGVDAVFAATKAYIDTTELMQMNGRYEFSPAGVRDLFGWLANNRRQIVDVHDGTLQDYAKYFIRNADWWARLGFGRDGQGGATVVIGADGADPIRLTTSAEMGDYGIDFATGEFRAALELARIVRSPDSAEHLKSAIDAAGGKDDARALFVSLENRLVEASHQRNVDKVSEGLRDALVAHKNDTGEISENLPIDTLLAGNDDLRHSLEVLATAYTNFSEETVEQLKQQLADDIRRTQRSDSPDGVEVHDSIVRKYLVLALQKARQAAARTRAEAGDFIEINTLVNTLEGDLDKYVGEVADRVRLDLFMDDVIAGQATRERLTFEWNEGELPRVFFAEVQVQPEDVRRDLRDLRALSQLLYWDQETNIKNLHLFFAEGRDETGTRQVIDAAREAVAMLDPARMPARPARLTNHDGETVYLEVRPNRVDAGLNLGLIALKMSIKHTPRMVQGGWKIWGDAADAKVLADNLVEIFKPTPGLDPKLRAKAHAMALSKAISLSDYAQWIATTAKEPWRFQTFGGTLSTAASFAADPFEPDAPKILTQAVIKDLLLWAQPELAIWFVAYDITNWGMQKAKLSWAKSGIVDLLVENGDWEAESDDGIPVLNGVFLNNGVYLTTDTSKRRQVCSGKSPPLSAGLMKLAKLPAMGSGMEGGVRLKESEQTIKPRELLLDVFDAEGFDKLDQVLKLVLAAVEAVHGGPVQTPTRRWSGAWLATMGVTSVPTDEDALIRTSDDITVDLNVPDWVDDRSWLRGGYVHELADAKEGTRRHFGMQVSEYWVRREFILECSVLDKLIAEAVKRKQDELVGEIDLSDIADEMADLRRRMEDLDRRVWPEIANSIGPFEGSKYAADSDTPLTDDYLDFISYLTAFLDEAITYSEDPAELPNPVAARRGDVSPSDEQRIEDHIELRNLARLAVRRMVEFVREYEDAYELSADSVLRRLASGNSLATTLGGRGVGIDLRKYHIPLRLENDWAPWDQPRPFMIDELLLDPTFSDPELQKQARKAMGTKDKFAAKTWEEAYQKRKDEVRANLGDIFQRFESRLRPMAERIGLRALRDLGGQILHSVYQISERWQFINAYEKAEGHPYWADLLLLQIQIQKLQNLLVPLAQGSEEKQTVAGGEAVELIKKMYLDGLPRTPESKPIKEPGSEQQYVSDLVTKMQERYRDLLKLAENMIDIKIKVTPGGFEETLDAKLHVTDMASFSIALEQNKELKGLLPADFTKLVGYYLWELVPIEESGTPADNPDCVFDSSEEYWFTESIEQKPGTPERNLRWRKRLIQAGKFRLRVTALSHAGVPLAQSDEQDILVHPVNITGKLNAVGDWDEEPVSVFLGPMGRISTHPRFTLSESDISGEGDFEKPLCDFETSEIPVADINKEPGGEAPAPFPPEQFGAYAGVVAGIAAQPTVTSSGLVSPYSIRLDPRSETVGVSYEARSAATPGKFKLDHDLKIHFKRMVEIDVIVTDATGAEVDGAEITLHAGDETVTGSGPFSLELKSDDRIEGSVVYDRGGIHLERPTRTIVYDPETHGKRIEFQVGLRFFDVGRLQVTGTFIAKPAGDDASARVAGGILGADMLDQQTVGVAAGGIFQFSNTKAVLVSSGIAIDAVLYDEEDRLLRPVSGARVEVADGRVTARLQIGPGVRNLGDISVGPFEISVGDIRVRPADWTGKRVPTADTTVTIGEDDNKNDMTAGVEIFTDGTATYEKYHGAVPIEATMTMPTGAPVKGETSLSLSDLGGPLDPKVPDTPIEVRIPVYMPGSLLVTGRVEADPPSGITAPSGVDLTLVQGAPTLTDEWNEIIGSDFGLDISVPVRASATLEVIATAEADGNTFEGSGSGSPRLTPLGDRGVARVGVIWLRTDAAGRDGPAADCGPAEEKLEEARNHLAAGRLDPADEAANEAERMVQELGDCRDLDVAIAILQGEIATIRRVLSAADAAIAQCNQSRMTQIRQEIAATTNPHSLLVDKDRTLERIGTTIDEIAALLQQSDKPYRQGNYDEVRRLIAEARAKLDAIEETTSCMAIRDWIDRIEGNLWPLPTAAGGSGSQPGNDDEAAEPIDRVHYLIAITGGGFTLHFSGGSFEMSGSHQEWMTLERDQNHDQAKADYKRRLLAGGCGVTGPWPIAPGKPAPPQFWQSGPEIVTVTDVLEERSEYKQELQFDWKNLNDDGPGLEVLIGAITKLGDCD